MSSAPMDFEQILLERPEANTRSVEDLLRDVKQGKLAIPHFQRPLKWNREDRRRLFDSILRGYPIGNLLLWERDQPAGSMEPERYEFGPFRIQAGVDKRRWLVVDGQQRITSLVGVMLCPSEGPAEWRLYFDTQTQNFEYVDDGDAPPWFLPLTETADTIRYLEWVQRLPENSNKSTWIKHANGIVKALRDYKIPLYIVQTDNETALREIFNRMNSYGKALGLTDVFNALYGRRNQKDTSDLEAVVTRLEKHGFGRMDQETVVKGVMAILDLDVTRDIRKELRQKQESQESDLHRALPDVERSAAHMIDFLREDAGILRIELVPYPFVLVPLLRFFHFYPQASKETRHQLQEWIWRGAASGTHKRTHVNHRREATQAIVKNDETEAVKKLLATIPQLRRGYEKGLLADKHDFRSGRTRLICSALLSLKPRQWETGEIFSVVDLIDECGFDGFVQIWSKYQFDDDDERALMIGTANRLFHPRTEGRSIRAILIETPDPDEQTLASHGVTAQALAALKQGNRKTFLTMRNKCLLGVIREFVETRLKV